MEIKGKIHRIEETTTVGQNNFKKREIYLDRRRKDDYSDKEYLNFNKLTFLGDEKTKIPDSFEVGDVVKCDVNVQGDFYQNQEQQERFSQNLICNTMILIRKTTSTTTTNNENNIYNAQ